MIFNIEKKLNGKIAYQGCIPKDIKAEQTINKPKTGRSIMIIILVGMLSPATNLSNFAAIFSNKPRLILSLFTVESYFLPCVI